MSDESIKALMEAADGMRRADDNLLQAILIIIRSGAATAMPNQFIGKKQGPVILLPDDMYSRLLEIDAEDRAQQTGAV